MTTWRDIADRIEGKIVGGDRSPLWRGFRDDFLRDAVCVVCGCRKKLVAHHRIPFRIAPDLELDPANVLPLCEAGRYGLNCHLLIGHLGAWQRVNVNVDADVAYWATRLRVGV